MLLSNSMISGHVLERGREEGSWAPSESPSWGQTARAWEPPLSEDSFQMSGPVVSQQGSCRSLRRGISSRYKVDIQEKLFSWTTSIIWLLMMSQKHAYSFTLDNYLVQIQPSTHPTTEDWQTSYSAMDQTYNHRMNSCHKPTLWTHQWILAKYHTCIHPSIQNNIY